MAEFEAKLQEMQKYLPFVQNVIEKLRSDTVEEGDNPRRAQLKKMEMLQDLLKNNGKKLKMETLLKCEGVLKRLHSKIEKLTLLQTDSDTSNKIDTSNATKNTTTKKVPTEGSKEKVKPKESNKSAIVLPESVEIVDITGPESPPPQPLEVEMQPVEIPTERRNSPTVVEVDQTKTHKHKWNHHHRDDQHRSSHDRHHSRHRRHHHRESAPNEQQLQRDLQRDSPRNPQRDSPRNPQRDSPRNLQRDSPRNSQRDSPRNSQRDSPRNSQRDLQRDAQGDLQRGPQRGLQRNPQRDPQRDLQRDIQRDSQRDPQCDSQREPPSDSQHGPQRDTQRDTPRFNNKLNWPQEVTQRSHDSRENRDYDSKMSRSQNLNPITRPNFTITRVWGDRKDSRRNDGFEEVYSPKQCWDNSSVSSKNGNSPVPTISLIDNSPPSEEIDSSVYHDTIYNFKKHAPNENTSVFSRDRNIDIPKPRLPTNVSEPLMSLKPAFCRSASISVPAKVPTIPEVLKSPPLSASDISNLFKEASNESSSNIPSVSEVGTRRPPKTKDTSNDASTCGTIPTLDMARKKLSIVTQSSPQLSNTSESLASPQTSTPNSTKLPLPTERIALKYNPHPRSEHNSFGKTATNKLITSVENPISKSADPRLNAGHAPVASTSLSASSASALAPTSGNPATFLNDPRLRKATTQPGLYKIPQITPGIPSLLSMPAVPVSYPMAPVPPPKYPGQNIPSLLDMPLPTVDPRINFCVPVQKSVAPMPHAHVNEMKTAGQDFSRERIVTRGPTAVPIASKDNYESEENWDSDPEPTPVPRKVLLNTPRVSPNVPTPSGRAFVEYGKANGNNSRAYMSSLSLIETGGITSIPLYGLQSARGPHAAQPFLNSRPIQYPGHSKFNALLNDKSERVKYFESKKERHHEPRTYAEFKRAKARAAAEEEAKRLAEKAAAEAEAVKVKKVKETEKEKEAGNIDDEKSALSKPPATSTLDKLYRSTDFNNCEFPKTKTSFKIPKKQTIATSTAKDEEKHDEKLNENKEDTGDKLEQQKKGEEQKKEENKKKVVQVNKNKTTKKTNSSVEKDVNTSNNNDELAVKLNRGTACEEKERVENEMEKGVASTDKNEKAKKKNEEENKSNKISTPVFSNKTAKAMSKVGKTVPEPKKTDLSNVTLTNSQELAIVVSSSEEEALSEKPQEAKPKTEKSDCELLKLLNSSEKSPIMPARILQRRNTMFQQGSTPEVDKEKIFSQNALVFEDIQGANAQQRVADITAKQRKNKCLLDIFQKTDDNCTVSTQNIISGKRRTRTTVNFNEVRRSAEIYHHKMPSEAKKDADKKTVKKQSPKGKKGDKGKQTVTSEADNTMTSNPELVNKNECLKEKGDTAIVVEKCEVNAPSTSKQTLGHATEETAKTHQLLEGFVQDIINPKSNKEYLFSLLSQILTDDKLNLVKEIVESAAIENVHRSDTPVEHDDDDSRSSTLKSGEEKAEKLSENQISGAKNLRKRKRNELDRLNEDIRDMFISAGVLTATGRRMCTLVAAEKANQEQPIAAGNASKQASVEKGVEPTSTKPTIPRIRKSKVMLRSINIEKYRNASKQKVEPYSDESNAESILHDSETGTTTSEKNSEKTIDDTPPRNMPVLKPHTPIKLSEVVDVTQQVSKKLPPTKKSKLKANKPGPKCKKTKNTSVSDEEDNGEYVDADAKGNVVRNTNKDWHSKSKYVKWCALCDCKLSYSVFHYKARHGEYYPSRLPPTVLEQLKAGQGAKPVFGVSVSKKSASYFYRCPFCLIHNSTVLQSWYDHLLIHTGEYYFECNRCHRPSNKQHILDNHFKTHCRGAVALINPRVAMGPELVAHICHICDFLQFNRVNLDKHYINQHDCKVDEAGNLGYSVMLLDTTNINYVDKQRAIELEAEQFEKLQNADELGSDVLENNGEKQVPFNINVPAPKIVLDEKKFKTAVEKKSPRRTIAEDDVGLAANSNVFVPTRDTNDSPTLNNFAQSLLTIENEHVTSKRPLSMAERLSQRFKSMQKRNVTKVAESKSNDETEMMTTTIETTVLEKEKRVIESDVLSNTSCIDTEKHDKIQTQLNSSTESVLTINDTVTSLGAGSQVTSDGDRGVSPTLGEDDDENWEDIEITESAPSTTSSIVSTSSTVSKASKGRNKNLFQKFNRLYATNNKLKKSLSITLCNRKKVPAKEGDQLSSVNEEAQADTTSTTQQEPTAPTVETEEPTKAVANNEAILGFRPLITNLDDLLPDSPCNDPIELAPELAPIESLQDLNDISSILNSEYISDMFVSSSNAVCIDADSQQTSIQEALDFVNEQQHLQSITHISSAQTLTLPAISRIENIGFSKSDNAFKFYCLSENCTFLYSNEAIGLESHFLLEHTDTKWKGYCHICKTNVDGLGNDNASGLPLSAELRHMNEKHVLELPAAESDQLKGDRSNSSEDRPRIKIRRLTGDCLSTTPTPPITSKAINAFDENAQPVCATSTTTQARSSTSISTAFLNIIEPPNSNVEKRHFQQIGAATTTTPTQSTAHSSKASGACSLLISNVVSLNEHSVGSSDNARENSKRATPTMQIPIISNVCSLNANQTRTCTADTLWTQPAVSDRTEPERSSAESQEVLRILANANGPSLAKRSDKTTLADISDSPEPQVVAETMPVSQATSGNFLITQTVSAQYEEGHVGFNISIAANPAARTSRSNSGSCSSPATTMPTTPLSSFKCQASGCKYQTCLPAAMGDHLRFHERQNFGAQREYLRCSHCTYRADDVEGYLHHAERVHQLETAPPTNESGERMLTLTQKIQNMLRETGGGSKRVSVDSIYDTNTNSSKGSSSDRETNEKEKSYRAELKETAKEMVATTGVPDAKLYRCPVDGCKTALTENTYYAHVVYHLTTLGNLNMNSYNYKCPHCTASYQRPHKIKVHIKTHAMHRFFCYICRTTTNSVDDMIKHFSESHFRCKSLRTTPLFESNATTESGAKNTTSKSSFYVTYTQVLNASMLQQFGEKLIAEWKVRKAALRTHFKPSEIGLLPLTPIFEKELNCAICPYKTKVRTNLTRHLQMHNDDTNGGGQHVANVDPVNPVPCLSSSEKHFDKMTNLASSSLVVGNTTMAASGKILAKLPYDYVPETKRYICGVSGCQYLTISEEIFRSHLNALHSEIIAYNCPHCKEEICKRNMSAERILNHLRFHSVRLFQCEECEYLHYMKSVVDRHVRTHDKQPAGATVNVITHDRTQPNVADKTSKPPTKPDVPAVTAGNDAAANKTKYKWSCSLCSQRATTQQQIMTHCATQHGCKHQYQCIHCTFGAMQLVQIMAHIDEKHPNCLRKARFVFHKMEGADILPNAIDTRPLWLRDDPTRVRHIRGILMEDEEESERYRKRLRLDDSDESESTADAEVAGNTTEHDAKSNEKLPVSHKRNLDANLYLGYYIFTCYYCIQGFSTYAELRTTHWPTAHAAILEQKPFRFRLCPQLGCMSCESYVGSPFELKAHMKEVHNLKRYSAFDPRSTTASLVCGHCNYTTDSHHNFVKHIYRLKHKPWDVKLLSPENLGELAKMGAAVVNLQCNKCMQLFGQPSGFHAHVSLAHAGVGDVTCRDVTNSLLYQCPMCVYSSTKEMLTLRHMIDHYSGFKRCIFCSEPQTTFNGYMQHCYSDHREEIKNEFRMKYPFLEIKRFLQQLLIILPSGFTFSLENIRLTACATEYGDNNMKQLYNEILRTSQQPPIPRLSIGRLVASKSLESQKQQASFASTAAAMQLAGNRIKDAQPAHAAARIMKRRSTVALGRDEMRYDFITPFEKKRKLNTNLNLLPPAPIELPTATYEEESNCSTSVYNISDEESNSEMQPYSYYGKPNEPIDITKVFIKIAAGDAMETKVSVEKFKLLYKIEPRVILENMDLTAYSNGKKYQSADGGSGHVKKTTKPCPASHKYKYR